MKIPYAAAHEAVLRRQLALYFQQMPPLSAQSAAARQRTRRALGVLLQLELHSLFTFAGHDRPLFYGDLAALLRALGEASAVLLRRYKGVSLTLDLPDRPVWAAYDPRLLPLAVTLLLRETCRRGQPSRLRLTVQPHALCIAVCSSRMLASSARRDAIREIARLHGGRLLSTDKTAALSISASTQKAVGEIASPTAESLLQNPLSPVYLGLYASLSDGG